MHCLNGDSCRVAAFCQAVVATFAWQLWNCGQFWPFDQALQAYFIPFFLHLRNMSSLLCVVPIAPQSKILKKLFTETSGNVLSNKIFWKFSMANGVPHATGRDHNTGECTRRLDVGNMPVRVMCVRAFGERMSHHCLGVRVIVSV